MIYACMLENKGKEGLIRYLININKKVTQYKLSSTFRDARVLSFLTFATNIRITIGTIEHLCCSSIRFDSVDKLQVVSSSLKFLALIRFLRCSAYGSKKSSFQFKRQSRTFICISASLSSSNLYNHHGVQ